MGWWVADLWNDDQRMRLFSWIIWVPVSICLHELGHGVAAIWEEDDTPVRTGHMTFDPMVHMGGTSLIVFALFGIAWGQMPVNPLRFRHRRMGEVIVAAAGPLVNLLLAAVALLILSIWVRYIGVETNFSRNFTIFLTTGGTLNFVLLLLNLIPLPPLDGSVIVAGLSRGARRLLARPEVQQFALFGFMLIFFVGGQYIFDGARAMVEGYCGFWFRLLP